LLIILNKMYYLGTEGSAWFSYFKENNDVLNQEFNQIQNTILQILNLFFCFAV